MTKYIVRERASDRIVLVTTDKAYAYDYAEKLSNKGYICVIRRY
jgi:hypothetical protein